MSDTPENISIRRNTLNEEYDNEIRQLLEDSNQLITAEHLESLKAMQQELFLLEEKILASCKLRA